MARRRQIVATIACLVLGGLTTHVAIRRTAEHSGEAELPEAPPRQLPSGGPDSREKLVAKIREQGDPNHLNGPCIVVSVDDFFAGNHCLGSIGCNLMPHPGIKYFYTVLSNMEARDDVQAVLIEINEVIDSDPTAWPFSENIFILTSAPGGTVAGWLAGLRPDEVYEGYHSGRPPAAPELLPGMKVYGAWWD